MAAEPRAERRPLSVVTDETPAPTGAPRWRFVDDVDVLNLPRPEWLVDDILERHSSAEIFGAPESFKSFLALDLSLCIGSGSEFAGRKVVPGPVVFVCGEGVGGMPPRVDAWKHAHEYNKRAGVHFLTSAVNLLDIAEVSGFVRAVRELGTDPVLVVFDTLARCMPGGDENRQQDMGIVIQSLDFVRENIASKPTTLVIHHTPRTGDNSRGSNSLDGGMETQIFVKREGTSDHVAIECRKQKNAEHFLTFTLARVPCQDSIVFEGPKNPIGPNWLIPADPAFKALRSLQDASLADGLTTSLWLKVSGQPHATFYLARKRLVADGYVDAATKRGGPNAITPKGIEALGAKVQR